MRITAPRLFVPWRMSEVSVIPSETSDQTKATPGPWKRGDCDSWIIWAPRYAATEWVSKGCTLGEPEAVVVAVIEVPAWAMGGLDWSEREAWLAEANATSNLIAAAPDMLEALKSAKELADVMEGLTSGRSDDEWVWAAQAKINAAIAKAEGRA